MIIAQNVSLKKYSNFKIGGNASYFASVNTTKELLDALKVWNDLKLNLGIFVMGGGTNILFEDSGYDGLIIKNNISFIKREGEMVSAGGGTMLQDLVGYCIQNSLSGLEWAGGLPGSVGGAIRGNAGAFKGDTSENIFEVESINKKTLELKKRNANECRFGYRHSIFKKGDGDNEIIVSASFILKKGDRNEIKKSTQEKIDYRIDRHPLDLPNIGSIFKNVPVSQVSEDVRKEFKKSIKQDPFPVIPVAKLLIGANLKGREINGAMFSEKHPNFIVNIKRAKSSDVKELIGLAKKEIKEKYDIQLEEEIMIV